MRLDRQVIVKKGDNMKGEDKYRIISFRIKIETIRGLDELAAKSNHTRNALVNLLLEEVLKNVKLEEDVQNEDKE